MISFKKSLRVEMREPCRMGGFAGGRAKPTGIRSVMSQDDEMRSRTIGETPPFYDVFENS